MEAYRINCEYFHGHILNPQSGFSFSSPDAIPDNSHFTIKNFKTPNPPRMRHCHFNNRSLFGPSTSRDHEVQFIYSLYINIFIFKEVTEASTFQSCWLMLNTDYRGRNKIFSIYFFLDENVVHVLHAQNLFHNLRKVSIRTRLRII